MAELELELELELKSKKKMEKSVKVDVDVIPEENPDMKGCFCAFDETPPPEGCVLCNQPPLHPDDSDNLLDGYAIGTLKEHRPHIDQIRKRYAQQIRQSYGFDFYECPGGEVQIEPILNVKDDPEFAIMMKLANRAIQEYNEKEDNVFKYKVLKIEKANCMIAGYIQYLMTVKVSNLTIGTSIETFHINASVRFPDRFEEILSCNPKGMVPEFSVFGKKKR